MQKKVFTQDIVYSLICEHPGLCGHEISKKLNMSSGRVYQALKSLKKTGFIITKTTKESKRKKVCFPVNAFKLLPNKIKKEVAVLKF